MMNEFNYVIGHYWEETGKIGAYAYHSEVQYGSLKDAEEFLTYVKKKSPDHEWKIFQLVEVPV
jgi:hypothetical protein